MKDEVFKRTLIEKLDDVSRKIDALTQVVAITSREGVINEGKTKTDQIVRLSDLGLSRKIIALIVGSTPESVRVRLSQLKAEREKTEKPKEGEEGHE